MIFPNVDQTLSNPMLADYNSAYAAPIAMHPPPANMEAYSHNTMMMDFTNQSLPPSLPLELMGHCDTSSSSILESPSIDPTLSESFFPAYYPPVLENPPLWNLPYFEPLFTRSKAANSSILFSMNFSNSRARSYPPMPQQKAAPQPPLKCHICNQSFSRKNSLRRHLQLHTGLKPYHCNTCSKSFARQDIYKRHMVSKRCLRLSEKKQMASNSPKEKD